VTCLSIVETSLVCFNRCCNLSSCGPFHILILSVWGLKGVGVWNHLLLWGDKSLSSWLRHPLETLLHKVEGRSSRQRTNARHGVATLLTLVCLLLLVCQYSFHVLEHKSLVYHGLEIFEVTCFQSISKSIIQTIEETLFLLLIGIHAIGSVAGKLRETSGILAHRHRSLLHILEFLFLKLDNTLRYVMRSESPLELLLVDAFGFFMSFYVCIPPISCGARDGNGLGSGQVKQKPDPQ
jgi:hypothetical protein